MTMTSNPFPIISSPSLSLLLLHHLLLLLCHRTQAGLYTRHPGLMFEPCPSSSVSGISTVTACVALCSQTDSLPCVAGSFRPSDGQCCLSDRSMAESGVTFVTDGDAEYFQLPQTVATPPTVDSWTMVFRAQAYTNRSVLDRWTSAGSHDDVTGHLQPPECATVVASNSCTGHVRSRLLDLWQAGVISVHKVKYSFHQGGAEVASVVFNGTGSDRDSWFHPSRLLSSTYSDLTEQQTYNFFSIQGLRSLALRSFYISHSHKGCSADYGWLVVVDRANCPYEAVGVTPLFLYSVKGTVTHWGQLGTDFGLADIMTICVTLA